MTDCHITLFFTISNEIGALDIVLSKLKLLGVNLTKIFSRPSKTLAWSYDFTVEFTLQKIDELENIQNSIKSCVQDVRVVGMNGQGNIVPWFPIRLADMDVFADHTVEYGDKLDADHPGFKDEEYRKRRIEITAVAKSYRTGQSLPRIEYTSEEISTWGIVYRKLKELYPTHACLEHQYVFPLLEQNCGYGPDCIPQLEDVSRYLKEISGFTLRPVMGLLSSRDFLNGLAFRVFHATQYIRHSSKPFYTPEPDLCHELLGHVPLLADPDFASFSQEIGLSSLGASDDDIQKLSSIYWYTIEFGLCKQGEEIRAYGAGLLSSYGELQYCLSDEPQVLPFDAYVASTRPYPITQFQPVYFVTESFKDALVRVREFSHSLKRPFTVRYNPYTNIVDVLDTKEKVERYALGIYNDFGNLIDAMKRLE